MKQLLLVGNPNCGKTTLFNALTGDNQRVGNWPGVTVEKKAGSFSLNATTVEITDLPGIYSLVSSTQGIGQDEEITIQAVIDNKVDIFINVVDACHLERHLYLTSQLLELGKPVIVALNMMDIAEERGITIELAALSKQLGCPVVALKAHLGCGLDQLKQQLVCPSTPSIPLPLKIPALQNLLDHTEKLLQEKGCETRLIPYVARRLIEGDSLLFPSLFSTIPCEKGFYPDVLMADARYQAVHMVVERVQHKKADSGEHFTAKLDRIVLHRLLALPIFFMAMYLTFLFAIHIGGAFQDFFDITTDAIFVQGTAFLLKMVHAPESMIALVAHGVGRGINTTLTFIPVLAAMYFVLAFLEASGYMARAAFVVDKLMRMLGLPGKAFVPMIVGFGCNVPGIMAARTMDSQHERILTILMSPFMSCSARLAIYAVFVAAFFPERGENVVFSLYFIGILMAVLTGLLLRKTLLNGEPSPLILELPTYHKPSLKRLMKETGFRLRYFIIRAMKLIVPACVILGGLNALTVNGGFSATEASSESVLSLFGQWLTPLFKPMGLQADNWPATVGLISGMLAKEVVVGSLNALYTQLANISVQADSAFDFLNAFKLALYSIPSHFSDHASIFSSISKGGYGEMSKYFTSQAAAYAYLLFILLYIPCVSTMAAIRQEIGRSFMWFSITWSLVVAYLTSVLFYQLATIKEHPWQTLEWIILAFTVIASIAFGLKRIANKPGEHHVTSAA